MRATNGHQRRAPTRTCVACRTTRNKRDLVRVVRTPDGRVVLDPTGRVSGRGAYLCADGNCWSLALQKGAIRRALNVELPAELTDQLRAGPGHAGTTLATLNTNTDQGDMSGKK